MDRLRLAHLPTPIERYARLSAELGVDLWVKRDDATGGVEAGNKIRKLEFLFADARAKGADAIVTCGAVQSNHCRATVAVATRLGMTSVVLLRSTDPSAPVPDTGNAFLMKLLGAEIRVVSPAEYADRTARMAAVADELGARGRRPYVIPEGGSNGLGSLGYVAAMGEVRDQLDAGEGGGDRFDVVVHACGSGGTAAGVALGCARFGVAPRVMAVAVCDSRAYFERVADRIVAEARALEPTVLVPPVTLDCDDRWKGPAYGVASDDQRGFVLGAARRHGLVLDPVYTGKALFGLASAIRADGLAGQRVLFLHTGGLPGLLAVSSELGL